MNYDLIVIGGGPAGMLAAAVAAAAGLKTVLLEKNEKLGKKLYLTGKGRCNVTNSCSFDELLTNTVSNKKFLYSAFRAFGPQELQELLQNLGLPLKIERGNRVFPQSDKSSDVIKAMQKYLKQSGAEVRLHCEVQHLLQRQHQVGGVVLRSGQHLMAKAVLLAGGGASYPSTGSDGSAYQLAQEAGHTVKEPLPALVPFICREPWVKELQGLSLKNVAVRISVSPRKSFELFGEMLFTHFGVSGPVILSLSSLCRPYLDNSRTLPLFIDLKPALSDAQLSARLQHDLDAAATRQFKNSLGQLLPHSLIPVFVQLSGIDPDKQSCQITKTERAALLQLLKNLPLTITGTRPLAEAIITSGGINVSEVNPSTMESRLVKNLYLAGEILDVDALTGGFNLQIAFSTGYLGGTCCARQLLARK